MYRLLWSRQDAVAVEFQPQCTGDLTALRAEHTGGVGIAWPFFNRAHHFGEDTIRPAALKSCHLRNRLEIFAGKFIRLAVDVIWWRFVHKPVGL